MIGCLNAKISVPSYRADFGLICSEIVSEDRELLSVPRRNEQFHLENLHGYDSRMKKETEIWAASIADVRFTETAHAKIQHFESLAAIPNGISGQSMSAI